MSLVSAGGQSFGLWRHGSNDCKTRRKTKSIANAALVEARPRAVPALRDGSGSSSGSVQRVLVAGRTDDLQAEAQAMTRAANASVYSPELLARKYSSRPVQVLLAIVHLFLFEFFYHSTKTKIFLSD